MPATLSAVDRELDVHVYVEEAVAELERLEETQINPRLVPVKEEEIESLGVAFAALSKKGFGLKSEGKVKRGKKAWHMFNLLGETKENYLLAEDGSIWVQRKASRDVTRSGLLKSAEPTIATISIPIPIIVLSKRDAKRNTPHSNGT